MKKILVIAGTMLFGYISANAAMTAPDTDIDNTATLSYNVGGTTQSVVTSNTDTFKVDRKIDIQVINQDNTDGVKTKDVIPGTIDQVLTFELSNAGNDAETYALTIADIAAGDQFDPTVCEIKDNTNAVITSILIAAETTVTVTIECDIPAAVPAVGGVNDGDNGTIVLTAAVQGRTKANDVADDKDTVQDVYADGAGETDAVYNGDHSDRGTYHVVSPKVTMTKSSIVISDPVTVAGGATEAHRIPGAIVRYCFVVDNSGTADASGVNIADDFSVDGKANLTYDKSGFVLQAITAACDCANIGDTSGSSASDVVTIPVGTVTGTGTPATQRACAYIEATIN